MYIKEADRKALFEFLENITKQATKEFHEWDVINGQPTFLVDQMQDLSYFMNLVSPKTTGHNKYDINGITLKCKIKSNPIKWLATDPDGEVMGFTRKPKIFNGCWVTEHRFAKFSQPDVKPYYGDWKDSLDKVG